MFIQDDQFSNRFDPVFDIVCAMIFAERAIPVVCRFQLYLLGQLHEIADFELIEAVRCKFSQLVEAMVVARDRRFCQVERYRYRTRRCLANLPIGEYVHVASVDGSRELFVRKLTAVNNPFFGSQIDQFFVPEYLGVEIDRPLFLHEVYRTASSFRESILPFKSGCLNASCLNAFRRVFKASPEYEVSRTRFTSMDNSEKSY